MENTDLMNNFHQTSTQILEDVANFFEASWPAADVDLLEDSVTITLPKGFQYVVNKHGVTRQIWVSSPFTGAHHFHLKEGQWQCTRTGIRLEDLLVKERKAHVS